MTENEARNWITEHYGTLAAERIAAFLDLVVLANAAQNLISPATIPTIWSRHVVDSAQLLSIAPADWQVWLDVGTGGGFPGMIVALLRPDHTVVMVEPRAKRAAFLQATIDSLVLPHAVVFARKVETVSLAADVISARAVAPTEKLLHAAAHCSKADTRWLLPRGRSGPHELAPTGSLVFHVEQSITDSQSAILIATGQAR